jgi:hypothetical protein
VGAVALHHPPRRGRRVGRGEDDDAAAPCAPKALARAFYVFFIFYVFMYYLSNEKKIKKKLCVGPLGAPHDPSGQCRTGCPRADPYGPNRTDSVSEMGRPAGDALTNSSFPYLFFLPFFGSDYHYETLPRRCVHASPLL